MGSCYKNDSFFFSVSETSIFYKPSLLVMKFFSLLFILFLLDSEE